MILSTKYRLPLAVFSLTFLLLAFVQLKMAGHPLLVAERYWQGAGWVQNCLTACSHNSIKYRFFKMKPEMARNLYLFLTISLHAAFLALAKI